MALLSERINHLLARYNTCNEPFVSRVRSPCQLPGTSCICPPKIPETKCICPQPLPRIPEPKCICGQCRIKPSSGEANYCARNSEAYTSQRKWPPCLTRPLPVVDCPGGKVNLKVYRTNTRPRTSCSLPKICCPRPCSPPPRSPSRRCPNTQPKCRSASRRHPSPAAECICDESSRNSRSWWKNEGVSRSTQCPSVYSYRDSTYASRQRRRCCPSPGRVFRGRQKSPPCRRRSTSSLDNPRNATRFSRSPRRQQRCQSRPLQDLECACVPPSWCGICARKEVERILASVSKQRCSCSKRSSSEDADCCLQVKRRPRRRSGSLTGAGLSNAYQIGLMKGMAYRPNTYERSSKCPTKCRVTFCH